MGGDPLTMGYFDNFDNKLLNKYKIITKEKKIIYIYIYILIVFQFFYNFIII
jgi:hypothetical protein